MDTPSTELSPEALEMVYAAVNTARDHQCKSVAALKDRMLMLWPEREEDIKAAIIFWANEVVRTHPNGMSRFD